MTKGNRIRKLRELNGFSQVELAEIIDVSKQTLYKYENDIITNIPSDKIEAIADATGSSPAFIMGWEESDDIDFDKYGFKKPVIRTLPVLGSVACGEPIWAEENKEYVDIEDAPLQTDFILIAKGDSMINARIFDGDYIFVQKCSIVNNGEIAVVIIENEATLKRVYFDAKAQTLTLQAENPAYPPMVFSGETLQQIQIIGKAIACLTPVK